jgi:hypothetical protein
MHGRQSCIVCYRQSINSVSSTNTHYTNWDRWTEGGQPGHIWYLFISGDNWILFDSLPICLLTSSPTLTAVIYNHDTISECHANTTCFSFAVHGDDDRNSTRTSSTRSPLLWVWSVWTMPRYVLPWHFGACAFHTPAHSHFQCVSGRVLFIVAGEFVRRRRITWTLFHTRQCTVRRAFGRVKVTLE